MRRCSVQCLRRVQGQVPIQPSHAHSLPPPSSSRPTLPTHSTPAASSLQPSSHSQHRDQISLLPTATSSEALISSTPTSAGLVVSSSSHPVTASALSFLAPAALASTQRRFQSQSYHHHQIAFMEGEVQDAHRGGAQNQRRLDASNIPHYVKCTVQNDRRELGLPEVDNWEEFAKDAIYLPSRGGAVWVGPDDPRCQKLMKRREKLREQPGQIARRAVRKDPVESLETHALRRYFTTQSNLSDPLSVAAGLHQAGMIKSTDVKHTASRLAYRPRPPIVAIMGHVDHGKTTMLDYLRRTNVAAGEAGGITQTIGAFKVRVGDAESYENNKSSTNSNASSSATAAKTTSSSSASTADAEPYFITFVDTPGHAAFNSMREAGAAITDIIVLVISAVDGVQPQTEEVIDIARKQGVPLVIAVNKIDRRSDIDHIIKRLRELDVELEEDGGDVQLVKVSAVDGTGIPALLDALRLQAELAEISTPTPSRTELLIIESKSSTKEGADGRNEVSAIVRCGTLRPGMVFVSGLTYGAIRQFTDEHGALMTSAPVGSPVSFGGFTMLPKPGNVLLQVSGEDHAKNFHLFMKDVYKAEGGREQLLQTLSMEASGQIYNRKPDNNSIRAFDSTPFNLVCKAETFGMLQAMLKMVYELPKLPGIALQVKITEVGGIKDADIAIASGTNQPGAFFVFGKVRDEHFMSIPSYMNVIRCDVLYHGIERLKECLVQTLPKHKKTRILATATCSQIFRASQAGKGNAAGLLVTSGTLNASAVTVQVMRRVNTDSDEREKVHEGSIRELRRFKDLVPSVESGLECGLIMHDDFTFATGDLIQEVEHYEEDRDVNAEFEAAVAVERRMRLMEMHHGSGGSSEEGKKDTAADGVNGKSTAGDAA